jgi:hypothetical protein
MLSLSNRKINIGSVKNASTVEKPTKRKVTKLSIQTNKEGTTRRGSKYRKIPRPVAAPFPPLN